MKITLVIVAVILVVLLAAYATCLCHRLYQQNRQRKTHKQAMLDKTNGDLRVLLQVLDQNQMSLTEAAIRISAHARILPDDGMNRHFQPFDQLARAAAHIPILDDWRALDRNDKARFERERIALEEQFRAEIVIATKALLDLPTYQYRQSS